ncbi:hypothetical protein ScPMuIL_011110 [Solemya velum]
MAVSNSITTAFLLLGVGFMFVQALHFHISVDLKHETGKEKCPCSDKSLCEPIKVINRKEVGVIAGEINRPNTVFNPVWTSVLDSTHCSLRKPCVTHNSSTSKPCVIDNTSTNKPCVTDNISTSKPCVIHNSSTSKPCVTDNTPKRKPCVNDDISTSKPCVTHNSPTQANRASPTSPQQAIFIFTLRNESKVWSQFDWSRVTSVVMVGFISPELMCFAHSKGARVILMANIPVSSLANKTKQLDWVVKKAIAVRDNHLDGINIDFESAIPANRSDLREAFTELVILTYVALKDLSHFLQLTVDVAWSPYCIDLRCYNYTMLALASEFVFVMGYDERSQIYGQCVAGANAAFNKTLSGLKQYMDLGIPANKLVLGVPWYGYFYPCLSLKGNICETRKVPFRGANCSDAAGRERNYSDLVQLLKNSTSGRIWDNDTKSPFFNYKNSSTGENYQIWYDDPESLALKYSLALEYDLLGVGMWHATALDYLHNTSEAIKEREAMWGALPRYNRTQQIVKPDGV